MSANKGYIIHCDKEHVENYDNLGLYKLMVNREIKTNIYKRYKKYIINGYVESDGYTHSFPTTLSTTFQIKKVGRIN